MHGCNARKRICVVPTMSRGHTRSGPSRAKAQPVGLSSSWGSVFPTYVFVDEEGIIRGRRSAYSMEVASWLDREVQKSLNARDKQGK
jgi:hypothetical protein